VSNSRARLVLLPGMDGSGVLFEDFSRESGFDSTAVSYPPDQPLGYEQLKKYGQTALPTDQSFVLLGESFSGPLAIRLAAQQPSGLRALILVCSFARAPVALFPPYLARVTAALPFWRLAPALAPKVLFNGHASKALNVAFARAIRSVKSEVWRARVRSVLSVDVVSDLGCINVPILYLRAQRDRVVGRGASEIIQRNNSRTEVVELDAPHFLLQTRPLEAIEVIRNFARAHEIKL
jgi:pimeloyl-[acyl-carrier protein] methyl ester esterase